MTWTPRLPADPRLLQLVKLVFEEGRRLARLGEDFAAMRACLFLDLAVEQMLHVLVDNLSEEASDSVRGDKDWKTLWGNATVAVRQRQAMARIPNNRRLRELHDIRNLAQHAGAIPNAQTVSGLVRHVEEMITECFRAVFGSDFSSFRVWDVIRNNQLRQLMVECEEARQSSRATCAVAGARVAFDLVVDSIAFARGLRGFADRPDFKRIAKARSRERSDVDRAARDALEEVGKALDKEIALLRVETVTSGLGVSIGETRRFMNSMPRVGVAAAGIWWPDFYESHIDDAAALAEFALAYLGGLLPFAQDAYPDELALIIIAVPLTEQPIWTGERV